jgi:hypothetical protein
MGEELEGASRIHPHPIGWRVAPTVDRAKRRYDDARLCDFCKYPNKEWVWAKVVSLNACNVDKSRCQRVGRPNVCTLETTGTPDRNIHNQLSPFLFPAPRQTSFFRVNAVHLQVIRSALPTSLTPIFYHLRHQLAELLGIPLCFFGACPCRQWRAIGPDGRCSSIRARGTVGLLILTSRTRSG